jgi:HAD superfamily hydrolase (TIGR01509 family)
MRWKAVIFDCDGTLVDSERIANEVLIEYLADFGVTLTMQESAARFNGVEMKDSLRQVEDLMGAPLPVDFVDTMRDRLEQALAQRLEPVDGVHRLVESLSVPYCIASNAPPEKIELSLRVTGLLPLFQGCIHSAYQIGSWKPDPALFLHAAKGMGVEPGQCAVVEDSIAGVRAGVAAGMAVFAYQPQRIDDRLPPDARIFSHFDELHDRFRESGMIE